MITPQIVRESVHIESLSPGSGGLVLGVRVQGHVVEDVGAAVARPRLEEERPELLHAVNAGVESAESEAEEGLMTAIIAYLTKDPRMGAEAMVTRLRSDRPELSGVVDLPAVRARKAVVQAESAPDETRRTVE